MKKHYLLNLFLIISLCTFIGCGSTDDSSNTGSKDDAANKDAPAKSDAAVASSGALQKDGIKLIPVNDSPKFNQAQLTLNTPKAGEALLTGMDVEYDFGVENFKLGNQTPDAEQKICANSKKGQHIHLILNNEPYSAHYNNKFKKKLPDGHYVQLAFLSRSYHESLKHKGAYSLTEFKVGSPADDEKLDFDPNGAHLFYSRPKGKYIGENDTKRVMLDFYVVNATLSANGYKVRATINGTPFMLTKWQPYFIEGLKDGENSIRIELLDKENKKVEGPFNFEERTITLISKEPITS